MEKKQHKNSCRQGKSRAGSVGVNTTGGGFNIGGLVVLGGTLAVTSLVAAFVVKKGSGRNADGKDLSKKDNQSNRGQRFVVNHQNQCCESKESPAQIDSCEKSIVADDPTSMTNGGNQNFTSDHHQGIVVVDDIKQEGINTSCDDCDGTEEFLTPVIDDGSLCEVAGKIENDLEENKRWKERMEARRQEESEDAEKTVAEIAPAVNSVDKEEEKQEVEKEEEKKEGDGNKEYLMQEEAVGAENMITDKTVGEVDEEEKVEKEDSHEEYAIEDEAVSAELLVPQKTEEEEEEEEQEEEDSNEDSVMEEEKVGAEKMVVEKTVGEETEDEVMEKGDNNEECAVEEGAVGAEMLAAERTVEEEKEEEEQEEEGDTNEDHINEEGAVGAEKMAAEKAAEEKEKEEDEEDSNEEHFIEEEAVGAKNMVGEKAAEEEEDEGDIKGKYSIEEEAVGAEKMAAQKAEAMRLVEDEDEDEDEDDEEEEEDSNDGYEESSEGTGSASNESNAEAIWPAESLEALSRELKNTMINLQSPEEKIVEEDGSTKTKDFVDFNYNSNSNILKNDLDHCKATDSPMKFKEEEMPGLVQIIGQTADSTKRKFWIWTMLALALLLLLAFAHRSALSYHFVNPSCFLVHDEL